MATIPTKYTYPANLPDLPLIILCHSWESSYADFVQATMERIATYGLFVVAISLSDNDASGRRAHDVYDVIQYYLTNFSDIIDTSHIAVVGYSGGGGNALACACKFPDSFNMVVSHFGMSDYGRNNPDGWWYNNGSGLASSIATAVGGDPATVPDNYYARDATAAIAQAYTAGHLYLFHDDGDTVVPIVHSERVGAAMLAAGLTNYTENYTDNTDNPRWLHQLPTSPNPIINTEQIWAAAMAAKTYPAWTIPASGTITVIGYMVTKLFSVWLGTTTEGGAGGGLTEAATVVYNTATDSYTVTPLTGATDVFVRQGAKTGTASGITTETEIVVV